MKKIAVITGASSGLGLEFLRLLRGRADLEEIWAVAAHEDKLRAAARECGEKVRIFPMDLADRENIKRLGDVMDGEDVSVSLLINSAGFAKFCSYDEISLDESLRMADVNIGATVAMGLVCIPRMERGGHILNIASQASFQPLPYQNIYSSTKAFVRNYSRALNVELKEKGITVTAVCPGWMATALIERGNIGAKKAVSRFCGMVSPDAVAKKALRDAMRGKDISVYGAYVKMCHVIAKILPQRAMMRLWLRQQNIEN